MQHKLKTLPQYFKAVQEGTKTFEVRENDRDYKVSNTLLLKEYGEYLNRFSSDIEKGYTGQKTTKEISYILEGGQYGLEEGYCILGLKQEGIQLKNINLTGWNGLEQYKKVEEELAEFKEAVEDYIINNTDKTKEHAIEEYLDVLQSCLGLLAISGISAEEVMKEYPKHIEKLKNRPRNKEE